MISFIHTADIHFGMENYGKIDPTTGLHSRLIDFYEALDFCVSLGIERKIDFFVFSGDAYKTAHPSPTHQRLLMKCFFRLQAAGIPIVIIVGNHDHPISFGKANALDVFDDLPINGFHVISKPTSFLLETKNGPVQIVGMPWPTRSMISLHAQHLSKSATELTQYISQAVSSIIKQQADALDPNIPAILAGHLTVTSGIFSGSEKRAIFGTDPVLMPSQLAIEPFDYVALGHLHRHQNLNPQGYPAIVYAGSIERVDFGERKEDKGFCLVHLAKGKTSYEFIPTPMRPFIQIEAELDTANAQTEQLLRIIQQHPIEQAIVKILYKLPAGTTDRVDLSVIQKACIAAQHVVGVLPLRAPQIREHRAAVKVGMDLPTLLNAYFDTKPELQEKKGNLIEKTLALSSEKDATQ
jgi:exonuclease SbcD